MRKHYCSKHGRSALLTTAALAAFLITVQAVMGLPRAAASNPEAEVRTAVGREDWKAISDATERWLAVDPVPASQAMAGYCSMQNGQYNRATQRFARLVTREDINEWLAWASDTARAYPDSCAARILRADAQARVGSYKDAINDLSEVAARKPDLSLVYEVRGLINCLAGNAAEAIEDLDRATRLKPDAAGAYCSRGVIRLMRGESKEAQADLLQAIAAAPDFAAAHSSLGVAYFLSGDSQRALEEFDISAEADPSYRDGRENRELLGRLLSQGRLPDDIDQHRRTLRSGTLVARYNLGVFGTGINSEADFDYAVKHADSLSSDRPKRYLYLGFESALGSAKPLPGVEKARQRGDFEVAVANPGKVDAACAKVNEFVARTVKQGYDPIVLVDMNKVWPKQLGNLSNNRTVTVPAEILASANNTFHREVRQLGAIGLSRISGHSDFTWPALKATEVATTKYGVPFDRADTESARSEAWLKQAIATSPKTQFTNVFTSRNDYFTAEAQFKPIGGYGKTLETFRGINAANYTGIEIKNPTEGKGIGRIGAAHGDPANLAKPFEVEVWRNGARQSTMTSTIGDLYKTSVTSKTDSYANDLSRIKLPPLRIVPDDDTRKKYRSFLGGGPNWPDGGGGGAAVSGYPSLTQRIDPVKPGGVLFEIPDEYFTTASGAAPSDSLVAASSSADAPRREGGRRSRAIRASLPVFPTTDYAGTPQASPGN